MIKAIPAKQRILMNGGLIDAVIAGAETHRSSRLFQQKFFTEDGTCLPASTVIRAPKHKRLFEAIGCPSFLFYTWGDLTKSVSDLRESLGDDITKSQEQAWFKPYADGWKGYAKRLSREGEKLRVDKNDTLDPSALRLFQAAYDAHQMAEAFSGVNPPQDAKAPPKEAE